MHVISNETVNFTSTVPLTRQGGSQHNTTPQCLCAFWSQARDHLLFRIGVRVCVDVIAL